VQSSHRWWRRKRSCGREAATPTATATSTETFSLLLQKKPYPKYCWFFV